MVKQNKPPITGKYRTLKNVLGESWTTINPQKALFLSDPKTADFTVVISKGEVGIKDASVSSIENDKIANELTVAKQNVVYSLHSYVLGVHSGFFKKLLVNDMLEFATKTTTLFNVNQEHFEFFLRYAYLEQLPPTKDYPVNILESLDFLDASDLFIKVVNVVTSEIDLFSLTNLQMSYLIDTRKEEMEPLVSLFYHNIESILERNDCLAKFTEELWIQILSSDRELCEEVDIVVAAVKWAKMIAKKTNLEKKIDFTTFKSSRLTTDFVHPNTYSAEVLFLL